MALQTELETPVYPFGLMGQMGQMGQMSQMGQVGQMGQMRQTPNMVLNPIAAAMGQNPVSLQISFYVHFFYIYVYFTDDATTKLNSSSTESSNGSRYIGFYVTESRRPI